MNVDALLRELAAKYETPSFIEGDPSWWMHQVEGAANQEATAFVAQALAYGSRAQFMPKIGWLLERASGDMDRWVRSGAFRADLPADSSACYYRLYTVADVCAFLESYRRLLDGYGTLGAYVGSATGIEAVDAITRWFGDTAPVPKDTSSACKRVCMFLRWMVRDGYAHGHPRPSAERPAGAALLKNRLYGRRAAPHRPPGADFPGRSPQRRLRPVWGRRLSRLTLFCYLCIIRTSEMII